MPSPPPLIVPRIAARRFLRRVLSFDEPLPDISTALARHGYIQIDPINICGRMHDLILRNRVAGYREGDLMRHLHGESPNAKNPNAKVLAPSERSAFEHHVPGTGILVAFPIEAWPHLLGAMRGWSLGRGAWAGRLTPREETLARHLLAEIAARGPLGSEDFDDPRRAKKVWGAAKLVKATLQKLFFHGRLLIAHRLNNRRRYDLPERVLPAAVLAQREAPAVETSRWLTLLKLRQRRLVTLKREELRLVEDAVQPVKVEGCPMLYCLRGDAAGLAESPAVVGSSSRGNEAGTVGPMEKCLVTSAVTIASTPRLLAPLDPLIYDRRVTAALWNFDYTWEAYTPPLKRVRGYYALPMLVGAEIVGHVDLKADRTARKLMIVSRRILRGHALAPATREFARWLGLR